jgi:hypothetical protein
MGHAYFIDYLSLSSYPYSVLTTCRTPSLDCVSCDPLDKAIVERPHAACINYAVEHFQLDELMIEKEKKREQPAGIDSMFRARAGDTNTLADVNS